MQKQLKSLQTTIAISPSQLFSGLFCFKKKQVLSIEQLLLNLPIDDVRVI